MFAMMFAMAIKTVEQDVMVVATVVMTMVVVENVIVVSVG